MNKVFKYDFFSYFEKDIFKYFNYSFLGKLQKSNDIQLNFYNMSDYRDKIKYKKIDDKTCGYNAGLILKFDFLCDMIDLIYGGNIPLIIHPSPTGVNFSQDIIRQLSKETHIMFLGSRYEGIDCRIIKHFNVLEVNIGDFILYDGDIVNMMMLNAIVRENFVNKKAKQNESFDNNLLEHDHYTLPREYRGLSIPDVLLGGNHAEIYKWQTDNSENKTLCNRSDLYVKYNKAKNKQK